MNEMKSIKAYAKQIKLAALGLLVACFALALGVRHMQKTKRVNIEARKLYDSWASLSTKDQKDQAQAYAELSHFLSRYPHLQKNYDIRVTQKLMVAGHYELADKLAKRGVAHLKNAHLKNYSEIACLIAQGKEQEALSQAQSLNEVLKAEMKLVEGRPSHEALLCQKAYFFNLYQVALLQEQKGENERAKEVFLELQEALVQGRSAHPLLAKGVEDFIACFTQKAFSFEDYLILKLTELTNN